MCLQTASGFGPGQARACCRGREALPDREIPFRKCRKNWRENEADPRRMKKFRRHSRPPPSCLPKILRFIGPKLKPERSSKSNQRTSKHKGSVGTSFLVVQGLNLGTPDSYLMTWFSQMSIGCSRLVSSVSFSLVLRQDSTMYNNGWASLNYDASSPRQGLRLVDVINKQLRSVWIRP